MIADMVTQRGTRAGDTGIEASDAVAGALASLVQLLPEPIAPEDPTRGLAAISSPPTRASSSCGRHNPAGSYTVKVFLKVGPRRKRRMDGRVTR